MKKSRETRQLTPAEQQEELTGDLCVRALPLWEELAGPQYLPDLLESSMRLSAAILEMERATTAVKVAMDEYVRVKKLIRGKRGSHEG